MNEPLRKFPWTALYVWTGGWLCCNIVAESLVLRGKKSGPEKEPHWTQSRLVIHTKNRSNLPSNLPNTTSTLCTFQHMLYCSDIGRSTTGHVYSQLAVPTFAIQPGELIQIISTGQGHWVTIFTIGTSHPIVNVYASLYPCAGAHLKAQRCCCNGNWEARAYPQIHWCIHKFASVLALEEKLELLFFLTTGTWEHTSGINSLKMECFQSAKSGE